MRRLVLLLLAAAVLCGVTACGGEATIPVQRLSDLVLTDRDLPRPFSPFFEGRQSTLDATSEVRSNPTRFGRKDGWISRFHRAGSAKTSGPLVVVSRADLFGSSGGAKEDLKAYAYEFAREPGTGRRSLKPPQIGDQAIGETFVQPGPTPIHFVIVAWRYRHASVNAEGFHVRLGDVLRRRPVLPVGHDRHEGPPERVVLRPAAGHRFAGRGGCVADVEDRGRELPHLVLGRELPDHQDAGGLADDDGARAERSEPVCRSRGRGQPDRRGRDQPGARCCSRAEPESGHAAVPQLPDLGRGVELRLLVPRRDLRGRLQRQRERPDRRGPGHEGRRPKGTGFWTDSRNGRGSGAPTSVEPGRNPICEQSDVFFDTYNIDGQANDNGGVHGNRHADPDFLVTPCPADIQDKGAGKNH